MDYTTDATTINYTETDYSSSSTSSTSYSSSSNNGSVNNAANETAIANITVEKEEKTAEQLHQELLERAYKSESASKLNKINLEEKKEILRLIPSYFIQIHQSILSSGEYKKKADIRKKLEADITPIIPEKEAREFAARLTMKFPEISQEYQALFGKALENWSYNVAIRVMNMKANLFTKTLDKFAEIIAPTVEDIQQYRQQIDPTKIPANEPSKNITDRYQSLIDKAFKNDISPDLGEAIATIRKAKEKEQFKEGEIIFKEDKIIPVNCGEIVVYLVETYPDYAERLKKLCPDIYKRKSAVQKQLEVETAERQKLQTGFNKMWKILKGKDIFNQEELAQLETIITPAN